MLKSSKLLRVSKDFFGEFQTAVFVIFDIRKTKDPALNATVVFGAGPRETCDPPQEIDRELELQIRGDFVEATQVRAETE